MIYTAWWKQDANEGNAAVMYKKLECDAKNYEGEIVTVKKKITFSG